MKHSRIYQVLFGLFLFIAGNLVSLSLSLVMLWGELEARLYAPQTGDETLRIHCPLAIAPWESGVIKTTITNTLTDQGTKPQINAVISHEKEARIVTETLELSPLESRSLQWKVDRADIIFERLILVNVLQRPYRDLHSRQGACSILVFSLFGWNGSTSIMLLASMGAVASLLGAAILYFLHRPFTERTKSFAQLNAIFLALIILGLLSALSRRWGLTLILDAAALLAITTGSVEIFLSRKK